MLHGFWIHQEHYDDDDVIIIYFIIIIIVLLLLQRNIETNHAVLGIITLWRTCHCTYRDCLLQGCFHRLCLSANHDFIPAARRSPASLFIAALHSPFPFSISISPVNISPVNNGTAVLCTVSTPYHSSLHSTRCIPSPAAIYLQQSTLSLTY